MLIATIKQLCKTIAIVLCNCNNNKKNKQKKNIKQLKFVQNAVQLVWNSQITTSSEDI